ncbi:ABC-2 type transporter [Luminiphilus syltensis NOR5-1B]|uniref:ABC-2 type transporter n=1 Tax=Luminiphilus syltensis NOR5-1B TaxID=565045 RepID=B8KWK8_9GAMM|nr:ABC transporter permease [Luminiphilus syltensis]EED35515.1 ABC-2 type transporter [Luminiphilus syltensis NOR5-1B]
MLKHYINLIRVRVATDLKAEASGYFLGLAWWILEPALYLVAFYCVFALGFRRGDEGFVSFLLIGLVHWKWFASSIANSTTSILQAKNLIQQIYLPKILFPLFVVAGNTVKYFVTLILLFSVLLWQHSLHLQYWYVLPLIMLIQLILITACATLAAVLVPLLGDLKPIIDNGLLLGMLISGIFFDIGDFAEPARTYFNLNPMAVLIGAYRTLLLEGELPAWGSVFYVLGLSLGLLYLSIALHRHYDRRLPKLIV